MADYKQFCSPGNLQGAADELCKSADQIGAGSLMGGGVILTICNTVSLKMKQKLMTGQVTFDVCFVARLLGGTFNGRITVC